MQLIQGATDRHIWSDTYQRELRSVLALQTDVARAVAREIKVTLTPLDERRLARTDDVDREAYDAYLKGLQYGRLPATRKSIEMSVEQFERAVRLDADYAPARAEQALAHAALGGVLGFFAPREYFPKSKAAARRALDIDGTLPQAQLAMANATLWYDWNWPEASRLFQRAIALNPSSEGAHYAYGSYLQSVGRFGEAIAERTRARDLDPRSAGRTADVGYPAYYAGRYDEAIAAFRRGLELDAGLFWSHLWIGQALLAKGLHAEAVAEIGRAVEESSRNTRVIATLGHAYAVSGRRVEALALRDELQARSTREYVSPYFMALIYAGLGMTDQVFAELDKALDEREPHLVLLNAEPPFRSLHADPRFQGLLRRIGFPS